MKNKRKSYKTQNSKKEKPPEGQNKEFLVLMWMLSHRAEDVEKRIFDEWSYNV